MVISFERKKIVYVEDYDELFTYFDFFLSKKEKTRRIPQGIDTDAGLALRVETEAATGTAEEKTVEKTFAMTFICLLYTSPSPRDATLSRMPSSA